MQTCLQISRSLTETNPTKSSFFHVHNQLYLALYDVKQAERMAHHSLKLKYVVVPICSSASNSSETWVNDTTDGFIPASLIELYKFDEMANQIARRNADHKLVFSAGRNLQVQMRAAFLIGCHMVMSHGFDADKVFQIFKSFEEFFGCSQVGILDCWRALHRAKSAGWVDFQERFDFDSCDETVAINMEEFIHYSRQACAATFTLKAQPQNGLAWLTRLP